MNETVSAKKIDIIEKSISDQFLMRKEVLDLEFNRRFQLLLSQLNLFKVIAGLVIALAGIAYFYSEIAFNGFLLVSIILSLCTLIISLSYSREIIDISSKESEELKIEVFTVTNENINIGVNAIKNNDPDSFFSYAKDRLKQNEVKQGNLVEHLNFIGEIVLFIFYLSIAFFIFSFLPDIHGTNIFLTPALVLSVYFLSFESWAIYSAEWLSSKLRPLQRRNSIRTYFKHNKSKKKI